MNPRRLALALLLTSVLVPGMALAQPISDGDKAAARQLTADGLAALQAKDFAGAAERFRRADSLYHAPTVLLGLARANVGLGKLVAAQEAYNRLVHGTLAPDASEAFVDAVRDGRAELAALVPRIPSLVIVVRGAEEGVRVTLDGVDVPPAVLGIKRPVDPGSHVIRAVARRFVPREGSVTVAEGKVETVTLDLVPAPPGTPDVELSRAEGPGGSALKPAGFAVLGVGVAGLVTGAITLGMAASKHTSLLAQCPTGHCDPSLQGTLGSEVDTYRTLGGIGVGGLAAGGVLAAAGTILVVTAPKARARTAVVSPIVSPGFMGAGVAGRF